VLLLSTLVISSKEHTKYVQRFMKGTLSSIFCPVEMIVGRWEVM